MLKQAYARAVMTGLVQSGLAAFPSAEKAAAVADYVAERIDIPLFDEKTGAALAVPTAVTAKIAEAIIDASNEFKKAGHQPAETPKMASVEDLAKVAHAHVLDLMKKAEGSTIEGGDKGNMPPGASAEAGMDNKQRPTGYAEDSRGKTEVDTKPGAVGKEQEHPNTPSNTPSGDNSVKEQSRTAALGAMIKKLAEGSTLMGGDKGNKEPTTGEGKMDKTQRPDGYAVLPSQGAPGAIPSMVTGPAVVGRETPHLNAPSNSPGGTNSVIQHSQKAAEDEAFLLVFKKTAEEVMPHMADLGLNDDEKIAHTKLMMGYSTEQKAAHILGLRRQKTAAAATSGAQPTSMKGPYGTEHNPEVTHQTARYDGRNANQKHGAEGGLAAVLENMKSKDDKGGEGGEKKDDKKDEKDEKEAAASGDLLARIRSLGAAQPAA